MEWWKQTETSSFGILPPKEGHSGAGSSSARDRDTKSGNGHRFGEAPFQDLSPIVRENKISNLTVPVPDMPDLKKKEKEKKGAAVPWVGSPVARSVVIGVRSSGSTGFWGLLNGARLAACLADAFGSGSLLGGLFASSMGSTFALAGVLAMCFLTAAGGIGAYARWVEQGGTAFKMPSLGPVESTIAVKKPGNHSLNYLVQANQGQVRFEADNTGVVPSQTGPERVHRKKHAKVDEVPPPPADAAKNGLNRDQFVQKMTSDPQSLHSGNKLQDAMSSFGGNFKKFDTGFNSSFSSLPKFNSSLSKLKSFSHQLTAFGSKKLTTLAGRTNNALGQARLARSMSVKGSNAGYVDAKGYAADAFDQRSSQGGQIKGIGDTGAGIVTPIGSGAPDTTGGTGITNPPSVGPGTNATPYQPQLDMARSLGMSAGSMKLISIILLAAGAALLILAYTLLSNCCTAPAGLALKVAAIALLAMGALMLTMSMKMANMGKALGDQISNQYGQKGQGQTIDDCMAQAAANGTNPNDCKPSTPNPIPTKDPVPPAIQRENSRSNYTVGGGASQ